MALNEFEGTVMLVSHDRALLRAVCDEFWMVSRGKVYPFDGDLDDYQQFLLDEAKRQREEAKKLTSPPVSVSKPSETALTKKPFLSPEQKKLIKQHDQLELKISQSHHQISLLEEKIAQLSDVAVITASGTELSLLQSELQKNEEQWLLISEQLEQFSTH
jgi:ATP-binding cassette, subfamily F, member 3